jgi:membrane protein YdbS with pleckstrin-like domain
MRYADTLLIQGEEVALRTRQHWLAVVIAARYGLVLWVAAVVLLVAGSFFRVTGQAANLIGVVALVLFIVGLLIVIIRYWQWWAQDYMVTSRRLMKVWGVLNKRSVDSALEHINDARLDQSFFGRMLNYGHLEILTAAEESTLDDYDMIKDPKGFKKVMLTQKHALDSGYDRRAPSPPLRTAAAAQEDQGAEYREEPAPVLGTPLAVGEPAAVPPAAEPEGDESLEVTQTLARLADLRDRGAISAEEYEAKKQELLDRL